MLDNMARPSRLSGVCGGNCGNLARDSRAKSSYPRARVRRTSHTERPRISAHHRYDELLVVEGGVELPFGSSGGTRSASVIWLSSCRLDAVTSSSVFCSLASV